MRALHTADWHIGQTLNGWSREAEHEVFLSEIANVLEEERIDLLLVAGDVFDNTNPSGESQRLLFRALAEFKKRQPSLTVVISGGNHDPALRLEAPGDLIETFDIHTIGTVRRRGAEIDIDSHLVPVPGEDGAPVAYVLAIPFLRAADLTGISFAAEGQGSSIIEAARSFHAELTAAAEARVGEAGRIALTEACQAVGLDEQRVLELHGAEAAAVEALQKRVTAAESEKANAEGACREREEEFAAIEAKGLPEKAKDHLEMRKGELETEKQARGETLGRLAQQIDVDTTAAKQLEGLETEIKSARNAAETWTAVNDAVGSARGDRFAQIAQAVTLALLVERANHHLDDLKPRYQLEVAPSDLALHVVDRDMAGDSRPTRLLSGGERFLISLALALALAGMGTRGALAGTLFIDEGFGSLDSDSLDLAIDALERLQAQGRTIGVISHVQAMKDRIPIQLQVTKTGGGASEVKLVFQ